MGRQAELIREKSLLLLAFLLRFYNQLAVYHTISVSLYPTPTSVVTYSLSPFAIHGSHNPNDFISSPFSTIYVLKCEHGKVYVGSTRNRRQRLAQHFDNHNSGRVWTNLHKPIRVLKVYTRVPCRYRLGMESQVTAELMLERGVNNVRGAMYSHPRQYTQDDTEALVGFLGHYNDLSYKDVRDQLESELAKAPQSSRLTFVVSDCQATSETCILCGELGHISSDCSYTESRDDAWSIRSLQKTDDDHYG
jgi:hypothetical protein